ncbi:hypothetical protein, partial [Photobacterium alginatilyticum]|uniref:hypothetical protein n=1 Tax=Photobacterium alginatilyticum TaxID=1775171 RepID=UPI0019622A56
MVECSSHISTISQAIRSAKGCLKVQRTAGCRFLCRLLPWQFSNEFHRYFALKGQLLVLTNSSV